MSLRLGSLFGTLCDKQDGLQSPDVHASLLESEIEPQIG